MTNVDKILLCVDSAESVADAVISTEETVRAIMEAAISGAEKKCAAVEIPSEAFRPSFMPKFLFRLGTGLMVDLVVRKFNDRFGHRWGG